MKVCRVENGAVVEGPIDVRPERSWRNTSNYFTKSPAEIREDGWRSYMEVKPDYDPLTEVREGPTVSINDTTVTYTWNVRPKTQAELAEQNARKRAALMSEADRDQWKVILFLLNEVRQLQGKQPVTKRQFIDRVMEL